MGSFCVAVFLLAFAGLSFTEGATTPYYGCPATPASLQACPNSKAWYKIETCKTPRLYMLGNFEQTCKKTWEFVARTQECFGWAMPAYYTLFTMRKACILPDGMIVVDSIFMKTRLNYYNQFCDKTKPRLDETTQEGGYLPTKLPRYCN